MFLLFSCKGVFLQVVFQSLVDFLGVIQLLSKLWNFGGKNRHQSPVAFRLSSHLKQAWRLLLRIAPWCRWKTCWFVQWIFQVLVIGGRDYITP